MSLTQQVKALLNSDPLVCEVHEASGGITFSTSQPTRGDDESWGDYIARLTADQLSSLDTGGLTMTTYSVLVNLGCAIFCNECEGYENEYMVELPVSE